jgi:hypothetical protein
MTTNETITLSNSTGLEVDFTAIEYADGFKGPTWLTANIEGSEIRALCHKDGNGLFSVTEDEVEIALIDWLSAHLKGKVTGFRWMWDTYRTAKVA